MSNILIDSLTPHPINSSIYSNRPDDDLVNSIRKYGIRVPLIVKADNTIISGHRRWAAAKKAGLESVPVDVVEFESEADEWRAMLIANQYRQEKRSSEMLEEAALWKRVYQAEGRKAMSEAASKANKNRNKQQEVDKSPGPPNWAEPKSDRETRKKVAAKIGTSATTLERIQRVKSAADAGDPVARQAWQQLDDGEITAHRAYTIVKGQSDERRGDDAAGAVPAADKGIAGKRWQDDRQDERTNEHDDTGTTSADRQTGGAAEQHPPRQSERQPTDRVEGSAGHAEHWLERVVAVWHDLPDNRRRSIIEIIIGWEQDREG